MGKKNGNGKHHGARESGASFLERSCLHAADEATLVSHKKAFSALAFAVGAGLRRDTGWLSQFERTMDMADIKAQKSRRHRS